MKKRNKNKNGWPGGSQNERTPRTAVPRKNVAADSDMETSAASTDGDDSDDDDNDDDDEDGTPAASIAGKIIEVYLAVDQGETGDKEAQLLEEAQEESSEEVKDKLVMEAHGQPTKQEFKTTELIPRRDGKFMFYKDGGGPRKSFNKMFRTLPFPTEESRSFGIATMAMGGSPIPMPASPFVPHLKSRSAPLNPEKAGVPGWNFPASEVSNQSDRTPSGLQECVGTGDRARSRARADAGGKDL